MSRLAPVFLSADWPIFFWGNVRRPFLERIRAALDEAEMPPTSAYVSVSANGTGDGYDLFTMAMSSIGLRDHRRIASPDDAEGLRWLDQAGLIFLSGGDCARGWRVLRDGRLIDRIAARRAAGGVLAAMSAGALQLGRKGWLGYSPATRDEIFDTSGLLPWVIDVHVDPACRRLAHVLSLVGEAGSAAVGIPNGAGTIVHAEGKLEPVRSSIMVLTRNGSGLTKQILEPCES